MQFSIVTCSRNRSERLPGFLASLAALDYPREDWELVFVDNGSEDDTARVFERYAAQLGLPHVFAREDRPGLGHARNTGVARAKHERLVFTDDDCFVSPDLLRAYRDAYAASDAGFIGGRVRLHAPTSARLSIQESDQRRDFPPYSLFEAGRIHGANVSMRRQALADVGMFDPRFGPGAPFRSGSDTEVLARILFAGWSGLYSPAPCVSHERGALSHAEVRAVRHRYDVGRGAYYMNMLRDPRARWIYLGHWLRRSARHVAAAEPAVVWRELRGAAMTWREPRRDAAIPLREPPPDAV